MNRTCLICGKESFKTEFIEVGIPILRCRHCGQVCSTYQPPEHYEGYFGEESLPGDAEFDYWGKAHAAMYAEFARRYMAGKSGKILDVGCGLGYFLKQMKQIPEWEIYGCETSPVAVEFGKKRLGIETLYQGPLETAPYSPEFFEIITLWDVLEHIPQPDALLKKSHSLLKPGGILFLHTPNADIQLPKAKLKKALFGMKEGMHFLEAKDHCQIYTPSTLAVLLKRNGFNEIKLTHLPPIMAVSGSSAPLKVALKRSWYYGAKTLSAFSLGKINLDNLFCQARK
jgi:2-polyprenyl-3-methyl-5-hydroxy-6-metoxy-1,4-benzoquinol methylase